MGVQPGISQRCNPEKKRAEPEMNKRGWSPKSDSTRGCGFQQPGHGTWSSSELPQNQPPPEYIQFSSDEKPSKDCLVMAGQPKRQVNVEIIRTLFCVAGRQIGQWAAALIYSENRALNQNQPRLDGSPRKLAPGTRDGNRHNACNEEKPNRGVQELDPNQRRDSYRLGFHKATLARSLHCSRFALPVACFARSLSS
jgi:hypothetical protein